MNRLRGAALAAALAGAGSVAIARGTRRIHENYFPLADEWAILAHSHPRVADLRSWFTEGFRNYFSPPPGVPGSGGTSFVRPLFNATYWAVGLGTTPDSPRYARINQVAVGACAGVVGHAVVRSGGSLRSAAGSGAAVPLMPAMVPSLLSLAHPCMSFDALTACFTQSAATAYDSGRHGITAAWLMAGVLTKETALPAAGAVPMLYAISHRRQLPHSRSARADFAALLTPAAAWYLMRRVAFRGVGMKESAYVLDDGARLQFLRRAAALAKFPFWTEFRTLRDRNWTTSKSTNAARLVANGLVMGGAIAALVSRLRARQCLSADESSFLASYAFMLAVGTTPRYGAALDVSLLTSLARWRQAGRQHAVSAKIVTAGLAVGVTADAIQLYRSYPRFERNFIEYATVGRKYVAALREFGPDDRVLVLNDPVTFWVPVRWLTRTMDITANVVKLADYPWVSHTLDGIADPSTVNLRPPDAPGGQWHFSSSRGVDVIAPARLLPADEARHLDYGDGVTIDLEPAPMDSPPMDGHARWAAMRIRVGDRPAHLLYYDPAIGEFRSVRTTTANSR